MAFGYGLVKGEFFHLQQFLDDFPVKEAIDDLVAQSLLEAVIIAEVACLGELAEGFKIVIDRFADLLCPSTKAPPLDDLIDSTFDVAFQGCNDLTLILSSVVKPQWRRKHIMTGPAVSSHEINSHKINSH